MKHIKGIKKEYIVMEKGELEGLLIDLSIYVAMVKKNALEAKCSNTDFVTGLRIDQIATISEGAAEYLADLRSELI